MSEIGQFFSLQNFSEFLDFSRFRPERGPFFSIFSMFLVFSRFLSIFLDFSRFRSISLFPCFWCGCFSPFFNTRAGLCFRFLLFPSLCTTIHCCFGANTRCTLCFHTDAPGLHVCFLVAKGAPTHISLVHIFACPWWLRVAPIAAGVQVSVAPCRQSETRIGMHLDVALFSLTNRLVAVAPLKNQHPSL